MLISTPRSLRPVEGLKSDSALAGCAFSLTSIVGALTGESIAREVSSEPSLSCSTLTWVSSSPPCVAPGFGNTWTSSESSWNRTDWQPKCSLSILRIIALTFSMYILCPPIARHAFSLDRVLCFSILVRILPSVLVGRWIWKKISQSGRLRRVIHVMNVGCSNFISNVSGNVRTAATTPKFRNFSSFVNLVSPSRFDWLHDHERGGEKVRNQRRISHLVCLRQDPTIQLSTLLIPSLLCVASLPESLSLHLRALQFTVFAS